MNSAPRRSRVASIVTAAQLLVLFMLGVNARAQNTSPMPAPGEANTPPAGQAPGTTGDELEKVTVTGYLIPRAWGHSQ